MDSIQIGPAGGNGGKPFDHYDVPANARLTAVHVYSEWVINALQIEYVDEQGRAEGRPPIGGLGGEKYSFYLDEDEVLTGISGRAGWYIDALRFHTNKRVSPDYGGAGGDRDFSFMAPAGYEIGGFFGRSAWYIDALGVIARKRVEQPAADTAEVDEDGQEESWMAPVDEGRELAATVVVRREAVSTQEEIEALEDAALAEAIAQVESDGEETDEGTVDVAVYTQVADDEATGQTIAVVMAVAAAAGEGGGIDVVGDEPNEVAVMVTDAITSEDDVDELEEEAVEGAIDTLFEQLGGEVEEVDVTIYAGLTESGESGEGYAAVVAIATPVGAASRATEAPAEAPAATRGVRGRKRDTAEPAAEATTGQRGGKGRKRAAGQAGEKRPQDLERVEGIGPKIAALLVEHGIKDLSDLAAAPVERLREILGGAGRRFRLADPDSWPEQAALGAAGLWDALAELQGRLRAGRRD
jgi:predicted flap endonuclease-1-like 5' DNA nuclease